jgi:hypothetical protein
VPIDGTGDIGQAFDAVGPFPDRSRKAFIELTIERHSPSSAPAASLRRPVEPLVARPWMGLGITLISRDAVTRELDEGTLEEWRCADLPRQRAWHVVARSDEELPAPPSFS